MTLKIGDSLTINERQIFIKEIFVFNGIMHIGYDDNQNTGFVMKTVTDFYNTYKDYLHTLAPLVLTEDDTIGSCIYNCGCHQ